MARRATDPVGGFRFVLELGFLQAAGFAECTGLSLETKVMEYREGGRNSHLLKFPEGGSLGTITLKRGIAVGPGSDALFAWQRDVMNGTFDAEANPNRRPADADSDIDSQVAIVLLDETGREAKRWRLFRAFPVKWSGPDLKGTANEVALETLELAFEGLDLA